jgi:hypothetical protein
VFWRTNKQLRAEIVALSWRVKILEDFAHDLCNHLEAVEKRPPRIAHVLEQWKPPDASRPM